MNPEEKKAYHREAARLSHLANPEKRKAYGAEWRMFNRERFAAMKRAWNLANPEKVKAQKQRGRKAQAAAIYLRNKAYQEANKDKLVVYRRRAYLKNPEAAHTCVMKRRGKIKNLGGKLTRGLTKRLLVAQNGLCVLCQCDLSVSGIHKDHIMPLARGGLHEDANIQLTCPTCNLSKGARV